MAQLVAQVPLKDKVVGSYPTSSTNMRLGPDGTAGVLHASIDSVRFREDALEYATERAQEMGL